MAVVAVSPDKRILCQEPGCGHSVYAAIHIVDIGGQLIAMGSSCFAKRFGSGHALGSPKYSASGIQQRRLTDEEREMLASNTQALLAQFEAEAAAMRAQALAKLARMRSLAPNPFEQAGTVPQAHSAPSFRPASAARPTQSPLATRSPWPWQNQRNTSVALFRSPTGQRWVRVQHQDGTQKIAPWPVFEGWEIALPPSCGIADMDLQAYAVHDIVIAVRTLRSLGFTDPLVGRWQDIKPRP